MLKPRFAIVGIILSAVFVAGCGGEEESKPVDLKGTTNTAQFKGMIEQQAKNLPGGKKAAVTPTPK